MLTSDTTEAACKQASASGSLRLCEGHASAAPHLFETDGTPGRLDALVGTLKPPGGPSIRASSEYNLGAESREELPLEGDDALIWLR